MFNKILFVVFLFAIPNFAFAASIPIGITINSETKDCACLVFDEDKYDVKLPKEWIGYTSVTDKNNPKILLTGYGKCNFSIDNCGGCCEEIGLKYIGIKYHSYPGGGISKDGNFDPFANISIEIPPQQFSDPPSPFEILIFFLPRVLWVLAIGLLIWIIWYFHRKKKN